MITVSICIPVVVRSLISHHNENKKNVDPWLTALNIEIVNLFTAVNFDILSSLTVR